MRREVHTNTVEVINFWMLGSVDNDSFYLFAFPMSDPCGVPVLVLYSLLQLFSSTRYGDRSLFCTVLE